VSGSRRLGIMGVAGAHSCCGVVAGRTVLVVVVAVGIWGRAGALGGELELWCTSLVEGMELEWVRRRVVGMVLVDSDLVGSVVDESTFLDGISLRWQWWYGRGLLVVVRLEDAGRCMCLLAVDMMALLLILFFCFGCVLVAMWDWKIKSHARRAVLMFRICW